MKRLSIVGTHEAWRCAELVLCFLNLFYGLWLLYPQTLPIGVETSYTYANALTELIGLGKDAFGLLFLITGVIRVYAVLQRRHTLRYYLALLAVWKWSLFLAFLLAANPSSVLGSFFSVCFIFSVIAFLSGGKCRVKGGRCQVGATHYPVEVVTPPRETADVEGK